MLPHSRFVATDSLHDDALTATVRHVRAHLSSVASETDSETEFADSVLVSYEDQHNGILVRGELDREPAAVYLREDFDPEQDVADNPLSVPSIVEGQ